METHGIAPHEVRKVRTGNAIMPGLALFAGLSFVVYLLVKLAAGTVPANWAMLAQLAISATLFAWGLRVMLRGRFHFVVVETDNGQQRFKGLSKQEQQAFVAQLTAQKDAYDRPSGA